MPPPRSPRCEQAIAALLDYLAAESRRDLAASLTALTADHCGFGTGHDEIVLDAAQVEAILVRQFAEAAPVEHRAEILHAVEVDERAVVIMARVAYQVEIDGAIESLAPRFSFVMRRDGDDWRLLHLHASFPWRLQQAGESYPLAEIRERNRQLERLVAERTQALEEAMAQLARAATTDKLTGLGNRAKLDELIADEHRTLARHPRPSSIAILDVDHFKRINDGYGHLTGDRVLRELAALLGGCVREVDRIGRWGGEEFLLLMPQASAQAARQVGERIRARLREHDFGVDGGVTVSIGVAAHRPGESVHAWISRADEMLYQAKNGGRDRILVDE